MPISVSFPRCLTLPLAALVAVLAVGCGTTQPPPEKASVPLPPGFSETGGAPLPEQWWRHFQDPRLDSVMSATLNGSFSLTAARARLRQARAAARVRGGDRLPSLSAEAGASVERSEGEATERYTAGFAASYELDLWGRIDAAVQSAELQARASKADLRAAGMTLSAEAASTFYRLLRQRAQIELVKEQREVSAQIAELIALRYRNGQAQLDELLRQRRLTEASESELASARAAAAELQNRLAALAGTSPGELTLPEGHEPVSVPPAPRLGVPSAWLNRRPDLRAAWLRVRAADADLAAAIATRYPRLDLTGSLESVAESPSALFDSWITSLAASLAVPLFRGGALEAEVDRSRAARAVAFNDYAQTVMDAVAEVETALSDERYARSRLESLEKQVTLAEEVVERLRRRYISGVADYLDVLSALTTLQEAQQQRLEARWAVVLGRIDLIRTVAGGWSLSPSAAAQNTANRIQ